jgi:DNA-binding XRE family transcriptional regulator
MEQDFLDEMISESTQRNPRFPQLMEESQQRRELLQKLAALRMAAHITQMTVARNIRTSQSAVARMEAGIVDPRLSSVQRYAASIGKRIEWRLVDA